MATCICAPGKGVAVLWFLAALASGTGAFTSSGDRFVAASSIQSLDGAWVAALPSRSLNLTASVPGDLVSDLQRAGLVGDPLLDVGFLDPAGVALWNATGWVYSRSFVVPDGTATSSSATAFLVFDSIKMGATVALNGRAVATAQSQFLRYVLPVSLLPGANEVRVTFDHALDTGRYMACTGGWDWAPYTNTHAATFDNTTEPTFTRGIVKAAYLAFVEPASAMVEHVVPRVAFVGDYPTAPLARGDFTVACRILLRFAPASGVQGVLHVAGSWLNATSEAVHVPAAGTATTLEVVLHLRADGVELWWPNGYGAQRQYELTTTFTPADPSSAPVSVVQPVGFRFAVLVTGNDTDAAFRQAAATGDGSGGHTMMLRVNGAPVLAVGSNVVPLEELEGRNTVAAHLNLAESLAAAHFTMARIWGGGVFMPDAFYERLSARGIMVSHDLMYAGGGHSPPTGGDALNEAELRFNARKLGYQAALVLYNGCNECGGGAGAITDFALPVIADEDPTRPVWPASPAHHGWLSGVNTLTGLPNGQPLTIGGLPVNETHGPYTFGSTSAFKPVNGNTPETDFSPEPLPAPGTAVCVPAWYAAGCSCTCSAVGPQHNGTFASEFGAVGHSSFESMAATLSPANWGVHANATVWSQRNYPTDSLVESYFGQSPGGDAGEFVLKRQMYLSMLAQALHLKQDIEQRRGSNTWALLTWMLNEIWPTGGWGSLEYGSAGQKKACVAAGGNSVPCGHVTGGRWKPLHHFFASSVFAPRTAALCANGSVYARNDAPGAFAGQLTVETIELTGRADRTLLRHDLALEAGAGTIEWVPASSALAACSDGSCALVIKVLDQHGATLSENLQAAVVPRSLQLPLADVSFAIHAAPTPVPAAAITVRASAAALWVALTTAADGYFTPNWFGLAKNEERAVAFIPFTGKVTAAVLKTLRLTTRAEHLGLYIL